MSLIYTLVVTGPPYGTQQASSAYQFAEALLIAGHKLHSIFFYQEGVSNANVLVSPASDEFNLVTAWQRLSLDYSIPLNVCIAAALRRGVTEGESTATHLSNLANGFTLSGLGALAEALLSSDRSMQF